MNERSPLKFLLLALMMGWMCQEAAALVTSPEKDEDLPAVVEGYIEGQKKATDAESAERAAAQKQAQSIRDTTANQIKSLRQPVKPAAPAPVAVVKPAVVEADNTANLVFWISAGSIGVLFLLIVVQVRKEMIRRREHEARLAESRQRQARLFKG